MRALSASQVRLILHWSCNSPDGSEFAGQLGDVMKESATIALTVAKRFLQLKQPFNHFFYATEINLHVPEGAIPKVCSFVMLNTARPSC